MTDDLEAAAEAFAAALPASVTLPAGTGKTHLLAATVKHLKSDGGTVLVLTHTNAGVNAIQRRLKAFGVADGARVSTLTSFAFLLARSYPRIGEMNVPQVPDWSASDDYIASAQRIVKSAVGKEVLGASFTHVLVDEYQDCSTEQHDLVCAIADAIPKTGILGDPMQAIFGFGNVSLVPWGIATGRFPDHSTPQNPWRWVEHNEPLGQWLLDIRDQLKVGATITFEGLEHLGIRFRLSTANDRQHVKVARYTSWPAGETVVVLGAWKNTVRTLGRDLGGTFSVMEEVAGDFMAGHLTTLAAASPAEYPLWLLAVTKACTTGHSDLNKGVKDRLERGATVGHLRRKGLNDALTALDTVVANPTYATLATAMDSILKCDALALHSDEAWEDIQSALLGAHAAGDDSTVLAAALTRARDRIRFRGRKNRHRQISRTVLVKGLEFDHVVIANIDQIKDLNNLYVALTRARKSIWIVGSSSAITVT